ncbi:MAG: hypothetical protein NNA23_03035 [Nitrospira sp.]|nr:hypothetical protein [Nitrospira sp.]
MGGTEHNPTLRDSHIRLRRGAIPVDLMLLKDDHDRTCLSRRRHYALGNLSLWIISPEDVVIHKLKAGRAQDFIDVLSILQRQTGSLDHASITDRAKKLETWEEWRYVGTQADASRP